MTGHSKGGAPVITLTAPPAETSGPRFLSAELVPDHGMMLLQARARTDDLGEFDLISSFSQEEVARRLRGGAFEPGRPAFAFGGAVLFPFANRIRGEASGDETITTCVLGETVRLAANWGGQAEGAERYAMHGLLLDKAPETTIFGPDQATGVFAADALGLAWPGRLEATVEWRLTARRLRLLVTIANRGEGPAPVGVGWHPYFAIPSGDRRQATLSLPAEGRTLTNNYDEVLPTGEMEPVAGTPFDFRTGRALGDLYLDDCFVDLRRQDGEVVVDIADPASNLLIRVASPSPAVKAIQTYAPPDGAFVVVEPQFNLANPFGAEWEGRDTGMVVLQPGELTTYEASVELLPWSGQNG